VALATVTVYALVAIQAADISLSNRTYRFGLADGLPWRLGMASLVVAVGFYLLADGGTSWRRPLHGPFRDVVWFMALWLIAVAVGTFVVGGGTLTWNGPVGLLRSVVVVPVIEELVYRGALFVLAERVAGDRWKGRAAWLFPIVFTGVVFWLGHLQYYAFDAFAWIENRGYTIFGGLAYGWLRHRTGSLWPALTVHSVGNAIALMAGSI
jgi:membrane protease YdiL (CAAX protease family)